MIEDPTVLYPAATDQIPEPRAALMRPAPAQLRIAQVHAPNTFRASRAAPAFRPELLPEM